MITQVLLTGNGINNISNTQSWEALLFKLHRDYYDSANVSFDEIKQKPFPLVYEQIVAWQFKKKKGEQIESVIKKLIAKEVNKIIPNAVHAAIINSRYNHIITANYEFTLMKTAGHKLTNKGCVKELLYSVFRHFEEGDKIYWHLHGDAQNTNSLNLGYEHYCGQLQRMREYVTGGYKTSNRKLTNDFKLPLLKRGYLNTATNRSWLDFFFKDNTRIKILGCKLDLEEIDLWWLLTYRAKIVYGAKKNLRTPVNNTIEYFIPREYTLNAAFSAKKDLMEKMAIKVKVLDIPHSENFYLKALKQ